MNIAVIGPEKFAFQDMVCVEMALALRGSGAYTLVPEPERGEDARLEWSDPTPCILEVQVKGAGGTISIQNVVEYLAHYPAREARPSLLRRLMDEEHTYAAFVLSARCGDDLVELIAHENRIRRPAARRISRVLGAAVRNQVARRVAELQGQRLSSLQRKRVEEQVELAQRSDTDYSRALGKLVLVERETAESVEVRLHTVMQKERFYSAMTRGVLARLTEEIATAKRDQRDVMPAFHRILAALAPTQLRPLNYLDRGVENDLLGEIREKRCLLLAGPPRSGKSWTSLAVGSRLQADGVEVRVGSHVDEADRYLSDNVEGLRAYILEDPLGSREAKVNPSAILGELSQLSSRIREGRYLIVVQTQNVLLAARGTDELSKCRVGSFSWSPLALLPLSVAVEIWTSAAEAQNVTPAAIARVVALIRSDMTLREPGALAYLAQTWTQLPDHPTDQEIAAQARRDAIDFARSLAEQHVGARDILVSAAIGTELSSPIASSELAFLSQGGDERPGFKKDYEASSFGGFEGKDAVPPPEYAASYELPMEFIETLKKLQRLRIFAMSGTGYNFTHPYLRAGAQALAMPDIVEDRQRLLELVGRGLACPSPITSLAAAENLRWMRPAFQEVDVAALFELARSGIRSRFPATRDSCFEFLVQFADQLPSEMRDELPHTAEEMIVSLNRIDVRFGIGFISNEYDWSGERVSVEDIQPYLQALEAGEPVALDVALSKRILQALDRAPGRMTQASMMRFLRADEAIVRSSAAKIWFSVQRSGDELVFDLVAADSTPSMSAGLLEVLGRNWSSLEIGRRWRIASIIEGHCESASCASVAYSRLVRFYRREEFGNDPPWELFAWLMPKVLSRLPLSVSIRNGRLNVAVERAIKNFEPAALAPLLEVWAQRIVTKSDSSILDENELSVVEPLLDIDPGDQRYEIIARLLGVRDTGVRIVTLSALIRGWERLSDQEIEIVLETIRGNRMDKAWLSAVALTRPRVPVEILREIADSHDLFQMGSVEIESSLGSELFDACIYVHCGWPQPLWWYGTHHASDLWDRIVLELAGRAEHRLHKLALIEVVSHQSEAATDVISALPLAALPETYQALLELQAGTNAEWRPQFWRTLVERLLQVKAVEDLVVAIDPLLEGIFDRVEDIRAWLSDGPLAMPVRRLVAQDYEALNAVTKMASILEALDSAEEALVTGAVDAVSAVRTIFFEDFLKRIEENPPRLHGTWGDVQDVLKRANGPEALLVRLENGRQHALHRHFHIRDEYTGWPCEPMLVGWCDATKNAV